MPQTGVSGSWFLAQYFATGDPGWIVPVQSMARVESTFNKEAFASLGRCYPDQELISAVVGGCVDPKDSLPEGDVFVGSNHKSSMAGWRFGQQRGEGEGAHVWVPHQCVPAGLPCHVRAHRGSTQEDAARAHLTRHNEAD